MNKVVNIVDPSSLESRIKTLRKFQYETGRFKTGISPKCSPKNIPAWFEPDLFKKAQHLFQNYTVVILLSQFYGLITGINIREFQIPLLATGNSQTVSRLFTRYISTIVHVRNWFSDDIFKIDSKAYKSLKLVRGFHQQVIDKLNRNDLKTENNSLWMSQWNMIDAQFAFMGYMTLFPNQIGFNLFSESDFHAMFHFWRVIGYCLGMDDDYNICSLQDEEIVEMCKQIYNQNYLPSIKAGNDKAKMGVGICRAICHLSPLNNYNAILRYCAEFMSLDKNHYPIDTLEDKMSYCVIWLSFNYFAKFRIYHWLSSWLFRLTLGQAVMFGKMHEWYCTIRYGKQSYEADATCPHKIHINYKSIYEERSLY